MSKGKEIGLQVNDQKPYCLIISRREHIQDLLTVGDLTFERASNFKYLGVDIVDINQQANSPEEINMENNGRK